MKRRDPDSKSRARSAEASGNCGWKKRLGWDRAGQEVPRGPSAKPWMGRKCWKHTGWSDGVEILFSKLNCVPASLEQPES